jgi:hypothetical protein
MLTTVSNDGTAFIFRNKQSKNSLLGLPDPADEGITIILNVCNYLAIDTVYYPSRFESSLRTQDVKIIRALVDLIFRAVHQRRNISKELHISIFRTIQDFTYYPQSGSPNTLAPPRQFTRLISQWTGSFIKTAVSVQNFTN